MKMNYLFLKIEGKVKSARCQRSEWMGVWKGKEHQWPSLEGKLEKYRNRAKGAVSYGSLCGD